MRILLAVAACVLITACSSTDTDTPAASEQSSSAAAPTESPSSAATAAAADVCDLLSESELATLVGGAPVGPAKPGLTGGLANCQWHTNDGRFVQTAGASASDWAQALPDILRMLEASGQFSDPENLRKLRAGADAVAAGHDLDPDQACSLFSEMVELQGKPAGTQSIVTTAPSSDEPQAVSGQMCSSGRFTSVMVASESGVLDQPLPIDQVGEALKSAHRRSLS